MTISRAVFDFYGFVKVRIESARGAYISYLSREFSPCKKRISQVSSPDIKIFVDLPQKGIGQVFDHDFRKIFRVRYTIGDLRSRTTLINFRSDWTINFYTPIMGTFLQTSVIEPIIYYKCLHNNVLFLHSACVSNEKEAFLFVASGGSGKTTTALQLVNRGLKFLSDDLTFITINGLALPYPRPLHLFSYVVQGLPFLELNLKNKTVLFIKDVLRYILSNLTGKRFYIATRVPLKEVLPKAQIGESLPVTKLFLLNRGESYRKLHVSDSNRDHIIEKIILTGDIDKILKSHILNNKLEERSWIERREIKVLTQFLENVEEFYEINPHTFSDSQWEKFANFLKGRRSCIDV